MSVDPDVGEDTERDGGAGVRSPSGGAGARSPSADAAGGPVGTDASRDDARQPDASSTQDIADSGIVEPLRQFYVDSASGNDANDGRSPATAWKSLAPVHRARFEPGDAVNFRRGSVFDGGGSLFIDDPGSESRPIVFRPYGDGARPRFSNDPKRAYQNAIDVRAPWVVVEGMFAADANQAAIAIAKGADHTVIRDMEVARAGIGVQVESEHNLITGCVAHDLTMVVDDPAPDNDFGAVGFWLYASHNEVVANRCVRCASHSYDYVQDGGFVEIFGTTTGQRIHHNVMEEGNGFVEMGGGKSSDVQIRYNVAIRTSGGFACVHDGLNSDALDRIVIEHNTAHVVPLPGSPWPPMAIGCMVAPQTAAKVQVRDNLFIVTGADGGISDRSDFGHSDNLLFFTAGASLRGFVLGAGERVADPLVVDLVGGDLRLTARSPALDAARTGTGDMDLDGKRVPAGAAPDVGAFEWGP